MSSNCVYSDKVAQKYYDKLMENDRLANVHFDTPPYAFKSMMGNYRCMPYPPGYTLSESDYQEYEEQLIESVLLLPDKTHNSLHDWLVHTEQNHTLSYPIESHVDLSDHPHAHQMMVRNELLHDSHPRLAMRHYSSLNPEEIAQVKKYVTIGLEQTPSGHSGSYFINNHLISAAKNLKTPDSVIIHPNGDKFNIHTFDNILTRNKNPYPDTEFTTYTGVKFDPATKMNAHGFLVSPSYISSSTNRATALRYSMNNFPNKTDHHILHIKHMNNDSGFYMGNREEFTPYKDDEFIMPRGSALKLNKTPHTYYSTYKGNTRAFHVWDAYRHNPNR